MTTHSDHIDADHESQESGSNDLISQFFSSQGTEIPADYKSGFVAIVGRPNVGKSSLLNKLAGAERVVVDPLAGTTRDPVDEHVQLDADRWLQRHQVGRWQRREHIACGH